MSNIFKLCSVNQDTIPSPSKHTYAKANPLLRLFILSFLSIHRITLHSTIHSPFLSLLPIDLTAKLCLSYKGLKRQSKQCALPFSSQNSCTAFSSLHPPTLFFLLFVKILSGWQVDWLDKNGKKQTDKGRNKKAVSYVLVCVSSHLWEMTFDGDPRLVPLSVNVTSFENSWQLFCHSMPSAYLLITLADGNDTCPLVWHMRASKCVYAHVCVEAITGCWQSMLSLLMCSKKVINLGWYLTIDSIRQKIMTPDRCW